MTICMIYLGIMLRCECMFGNENIENGLNCFFFEKEHFPLFSFVQLPMVLVHSDSVFCTFTEPVVQMLKCFCTFGFCFCTFVFRVLLGGYSCTVGTLSCTLGGVYCTLGLKFCTNEVKQ